MTSWAPGRAVRPFAWLRRKRSERQDESGGLSGLDSLRKHQEGRKEGRADGSGAKGQEATANDWKSRSEGIRPDWRGRGMEGGKKKEEVPAAAWNSSLVQSSSWGISEWRQVGVAGGINPMFGINGRVVSGANGCISIRRRVDDLLGCQSCSGGIPMFQKKTN